VNAPRPRFEVDIRTAFLKFNDCANEQGYGLKQSNAVDETIIESKI